MLKNRVAHEEREALMQSIKSRLASDFFKLHSLEDDLKVEFFYFCADDENFITKCKNQTDFEILKFLAIKHEQFLKNISDNQD